VSVPRYVAVRELSRHDENVGRTVLSRWRWSGPSRPARVRRRPVLRYWTAEAHGVCDPATAWLDGKGATRFSRIRIARCAAAGHFAASRKGSFPPLAAHHASSRSIRADRP
jgi:hypothetical protein